MDNRKEKQFWQTLSTLALPSMRYKDAHLLNFLRQSHKNSTELFLVHFHGIIPWPGHVVIRSATELAVETNN